MSKNNFMIGDTVELDCPTLLGNTRSSSKITGQITEIFDALFADGSEGNLEIDIIYKSGWIRYKPHKDGGTLTLIKRKI